MMNNYSVEENSGNFLGYGGHFHDLISAGFKLRRHSETLDHMRTYLKRKNFKYIQEHSISCVELSLLELKDPQILKTY